MNENVLIALIDEIKRLNKNLEDHNDILISHYIATGEIEMDEIDFDVAGLDS